MTNPPWIDDVPEDEVQDVPVLEPTPADWDAADAATAAWEANLDGRPTHTFCDVYEPHEEHLYRAINTDTYLCPGITAAALDEIEYRYSAPCEHGLSAYLCAGPNHYPTDY